MMCFFLKKKKERHALIVQLADGSSALLSDLCHPT